MADHKNNNQHDPYQAYLAEKHGKLNAPEEIIAGEVEKAIGSTPSSKTRLILGEVNEVYDVVTEAGQSVIVRISRSKHPRFDVEKWAIDAARRVGVPAPEVLLIDKVSAGSEPLTFSIERKIDGVAFKDVMDDLRKNNPGLFKDIIIEAGRILSQIHSVTTTQFGGLDKRGSEVPQGWEEFIFGIEKKRERIIEAAKKLEIDAEQIDQALDILKSNRRLFEGVESQLLHGDFSSKHLLIRDGHIVGIIDFENARGGDPLYDFAWTNFFYKDKIPMEWIKQGYEDKSIFGDNFEKKLHLYRLHLGLGFIEYYVSENNQSGMNYVKERFLEELQFFSSV